jgi:hypothetical protein
VVRDYLRLGFAHILAGLDHLLFVLGLVLLVCGRRRLLFGLLHGLGFTGALAQVGLPASAETPRFEHIKLRRWGWSDLPTATPRLHLTLLTPLVKGGTHRGKRALIPQNHSVGKGLQEEGMTVRKHALPL